MRNRIKQINKYLIYDIFGAVVYGLILYFGFTWLAGFSLLYAYLWNYALIILAVSLDIGVSKIMQSDELVMLLKKKHGAEKTGLMLSGGFISFKTLIYFFYLFILTASQIIDFNPELIGGNLAGFVLSNNYSILFLLAVDTLVGQFAKDRGKTKKILEKLKESANENQD